MCKNPVDSESIKQNSIAVTSEPLLIEYSYLQTMNHIATGKASIFIELIILSSFNSSTYMLFSVNKDKNEYEQNRKLESKENKTNLVIYDGTKTIGKTTGV